MMSDGTESQLCKCALRRFVLGAVFSVAGMMTAFASEGAVIINELNYHPPEDRDDLQFVEIHNRGEAAVDLSRWSFSKGIRFSFPERTTIAPGAYMVVCRDREAFEKNYGKDVPLVGEFKGRLSHGGENIVLSDAQGKAVSSLEYSDNSPWPTGPDGYSPSLERICPDVPGSNLNNWSASNMPKVKRAAGSPGRRNDAYSGNLPPIVTLGEFNTPLPDRKAPVSCEVSDPGGIKSVTLHYCLAKVGGATSETVVPMQLVKGDDKSGVYRAEIAGQPEDRLVRFRIQAVNVAGAVRSLPPPNEPRPTFSYCTFVNRNSGTIAFGHLIEVSDYDVALPRKQSFLGRLLGGPSEGRGAVLFGPPREASGPEPARGNSAFIYMPPGSDEVLTFDHVHSRPRKGGFKVHFQKDKPFKGMTGINVVFDGPPRWVLAEALSFDLYRMAGVPACETEHLRVWKNGRLLGYQLLIEQPNSAFLTRHTGDNSGNLYKYLWYGRDLVTQHEKKTNPLTGHDDLLALIDGLDRTAGAEQWEYIQKHFDVDEFLNYYAVGMCIQNWDGFFNNHYLYHDLEGTGKWTIYPWDEDKTWGDYDGASKNFDWYDMPLTYGMKGDRPPSFDQNRTSNPFAFPRMGWWRAGGRIAGPLLANEEFRRRFFVRLDEVCNTVFTEEKFLPVIDALEKRLEPEIEVRAKAMGENPDQSLNLFRHHMQTFRNQLKHRREFLLKELAKATDAPKGTAEPQ